MSMPVPAVRFTFTERGSAFKFGGIDSVSHIGETRSRPVKSMFRPQFWDFSGVTMAQLCDICGKGPRFGNKISHAHNVTKRRWNVNLRPVRARVKGATKKLRVCTSCLRSGKVVMA